MGGAGWRISAHNLDGVLQSISIGFSVDDAVSQRHFAQLTAGASANVSSATYVARFSAATVPAVMAAFREVDANGDITYDSEVIGREPLKSWLTQILAFSLLGAAFFEVVRALQKRRKLRAEIAERSANPM